MRLIAQKLHRGGADFDVVLLKHRIYRGPKSSDLLAGFLVDIIVGERGCRHCASYVLGTVLRPYRHLHADLRIHCYQSFSSTVGGSKFLARCEHNLVFGRAVVRTKGNGIRLRPGKGTCHLVAVRIHSCHVGQLHSGKSCAIGNVLAVHRIGIVHLRSDGHGLLQNLQGYAFPACGGENLTVVIGKGDGHRQWVAQAGARLRRLALLHHRHGKLIDIGGEVFVRSQSSHSARDIVLHAGEVFQLHRIRIRNDFQCLGNHAFRGIGGEPGGCVFTISCGTLGDRHVDGLAVQSRARPAGELIAVRRGVTQYNIIALNGVTCGIGFRCFTADEVVVNLIFNNVPYRSQGDFAGNASGYVNTAVLIPFQRLNARHLPAAEVIALTGGRIQGKSAALNVMGDRVFRMVCAIFAQHIGDGIIRR